MGFDPIASVGNALEAGARIVGDVAQQAGDAFDGALEAAQNLSLSDVGHTVLDVAGMVPVIGEPADLANAGWYAAEGKWADAALSAAAIIPLAGNVATATKWGKRAANAAEAGGEVAKTLERADHVADARKLAERGDAAIDGAKADKAKRPGKAEDSAPGPRSIELTTITRRQGRNEMEWNVDSQGRFVSGKARLEEDFAGRKARGTDEKKAQREAAARGVEGDQGGHMFAHRFVKDQGPINLVPQNGDLNNDVWGRMENEWADWIESGRRVDVEISASPAGADRPDTFRVTYDVVDRASGKIVYSNSKRFLNQAGQEFKRTPANDIRNWKG